MTKQKAKQLEEQYDNFVDLLAIYIHQRQKTALAGYHPTLTVSTEHTNLGIQIRVHDNGIGIGFPESVRQKIFQPFFSTKPTGEGTGLGLSLAYDIVTKGHGGTLEEKSTEGVGAVFTVRLPFTEKAL